MVNITIKFFSQSLAKATTVYVLLNDAARPPYPTYYLLHGLSDDHSMWTRNTSLERHAASYPFMFIMPDCARSFYTDSCLGHYESFIVKDLIPFIDRTFPTRTARRYRSVGGLSMGGYGALKFGLKFPKLFSVIAAHSSATYFCHKWQDSALGIPEVKPILDSVNPSHNSVFALADTCPKKGRPSVYFDCGTQDFLYSSNKDFHRHLLRTKFAHTFRSFPGEHNWEYWDEHIQDAMRFVAKAMRLKRL